MRFDHTILLLKDRQLEQELKRTASLGVPLALGELGWMSTYIVDAIMVGRLPHSALAISASSLGNTIFYAIVFCVIRGLDGIETLVAQCYGHEATDSSEECLRILAQSMWFLLIGAPLVILMTLASIPLLSHFGVSAEIVEETRRYLNALVWSTAPLLLYMALRRYLQSINHVMLITISLVTANLINFLGDWALLYGHLGARPMGIAGSGWATSIVRLYMVALLLVGFFVALRQQKLRLHWSYLRPDFNRLRQLAAVGWPSGLQNVTDLGFSTWMSVVCARLGTTLLAAHQVVLDLDAFIYMVPMGLSYAAVIRVGQSAGQGSLPGVRRSASASLILCMGYISIASLLFAGLPRLWASIYTTDPRVIAAAIPIFLICGLLQIGDAASVIYASALAGLGDTRTPFIVNTLIYWAAGAPLGWYLAFHSSLALTGLWIGRAVAAIATGVIMAFAWRTRIQHFKKGRRISIFTLLRPLQSLQMK
jgi:MATE family multidrug resistance protein